MTKSQFQNTSDWIDAKNAQDPNIEIYQSKRYPKELLYSNRMYQRLMSFYPEASEEVQIASKAQHICRWEVARESFPMDRVGYLKWREDLKKFHANTTAIILKKAGYSEEFIARVSFLIEKKLLKKDTETQLLEDVICLVFLEYYLDPFVHKHDREKLKNIILKTWNKMSEKGHQEALKINFSTTNFQLIKEALGL
ncbi:MULTISPECIES: DUF4202 domain-containing protein [Flavobacterium]|uniref:DUF4202 domain-containing protein n=1 Tax=Flavobacterium ranwuense TaxID=2541725 RepID=A0ABY2DU31_9FLAO|nr:MULTISPECIES: DUF4202 domain-containing protein [Flavobacterium]TDE31219.1 DUF4202 domain-containing protein [Flavobacterium ranwuense]TDE55483.1 DUF4202 domain-containing protein [Flavobacterium sp. GT3P67]